MAGAAVVRLFDYVDSGSWQVMDLVTMGFFLVVGLGWSIAMQRHLALLSPEA